MVTSVLESVSLLLRLLRRFKLSLDADVELVVGFDDGDGNDDSGLDANVNVFFDN